MLNCKEVADLIASESLVRAGLRQRALVRLHLLICRDCPGYAQQLRAIGLAGRARWKANPSDAPTLERLQSSIVDRAIAISDLEPPARND